MIRHQLRIVCCYVPGQLRSETLNSLQTFHGNGEVRVGYVGLRESEPFDYGEALAFAWQRSLEDHTDLAIVEQDIVIDANVIADFRDCPCLYGGRPYSWGPEVGIALGCTRFRHEFIVKYPTAMREAVALNLAWNQFDVGFQRHILVRRYGEQPHICGPTVVHLNEAKQLREDADPTPIASLPAW